ncbi:MAG: GTP-binding protein [Bacteroidetes bacterium]|nr:GTP-binding protein [Bacteroidota bacterium]
MENIVQQHRMNIVIAGHVDHGKSTLIGRLLVDTNSLPEGKLEQVKRLCEKNSKPFEYAFLLDSLQDEQSHGITIDTTRIFFKSKLREYIIIDAPGHIEFLKNMVSGAARAEAAILLIDAHEGVAENSKRHAYMMSFLGIKQIAVAINKMDLVGYSEEKYLQIKNEYEKFLEKIGIEPVAFVPTAAREGVNLNSLSEKIKWYKGKTLLEIINSFSKKDVILESPFRMYAQGVYKFAGHNNKRRTIAGTINSGSISVGDEIIFYPSGKKSKVLSIEEFYKPPKNIAVVGEAIGLTLTEELYIPQTELICKINEPQPKLTNRFKASIFWMGKKPLSLNKKYKLKIGTQNVSAVIEKIENVLNTSELQYFDNKITVEKHEVALCIVKTDSKTAFDLVHEMEATSRFVLVDNYDISGGGIINENMAEATVIVQQKYSDFEIALNNFIRENFPHWEAKPLGQEG